MAKIEVDEKVFKKLVQENEDNKTLIKELIDKVDLMNTATLQGIGIDPVLAARNKLGTKLVQFKRNYNRAGRPSLIQNGVCTHEAYSAAAGDVVNLKVDEFQRIKNDFPDLLETNKSRFKGKTVFDIELQLNKKNQTVPVRVPRKIEAEKLIEIAPSLG